MEVTGGVRVPTVSFHKQGHGVTVSQKVCSWMRLPSDGSCMALACLSSICDGSRVCRDAAVVLDVLKLGPSCGGHESWRDGS